MICLSFLFLNAEAHLSLKNFTYMKILFISLLISFIFASPQVQLKGTYEGNLMNTKVVANFKTVENMVFGFIFESKDRHHRLRGEIYNDSLKGILSLYGKTDMPCDGVIKDKGRLIELKAVLTKENSVMQEINISLTKVSNAVEIDFEKYFPEQKIEKQYDPAIIGKWEHIKRVNDKQEDIASQSSQEHTMICYKKGVLNMISPQLKYPKDIPKPTMIWYTNNQVLYTEIEMPKSGEILKTDTEYKINGDTLITYSKNGNSSIYIRK